MSATPEMIAARKLNTVRYAVEDFDDGVKNIRRIALPFGLLALLMLLSLLSDADNIPHFIACLVMIAFVFVVPRFDYLDATNLSVLTITFFALLAVEWLSYGLPDLIVPKLNLRNWRGWLVWLNHLTPFLYWGVKILSSIYIVWVWVFRQKVLAQPGDLLEKVLRSREG